MPVNVAIFASGNGSNAENIIIYFANNASIKINLVVTNNSKAYVLERVKKFLIPTFLIDLKKSNADVNLLNELENKNINFIVLAGYLKLIPKLIIEKFQSKILNIHPALLPDYGGKGMFGNNVHQAIINDNCLNSGITIHYVNEAYDEGQIVFQTKCNIENNETVESLANKIHLLEHQYYPIIIEETIKKQFNL